MKILAALILTLTLSTAAGAAENSSPVDSGTTADAEYKTQGSDSPQALAGKKTVHHRAHHKPKKTTTTDTGTK